jgi:hypothetical protein
MGKAMNIFPIPPDRIRGLNSNVWEGLERSLTFNDRGFEVGDIKELLEQGRLVLVILTDGPVWQAAIVCEHVKYPQMLRVRILAMTGFAPLEVWLYEFRDRMLDYAKNVGASGFEAVLRPGLARKLGFAHAPRWAGMES